MSDEIFLFVFVDALLQVTADGKPLPIDQWEKSPPDSCRVAVMSRHFIDTTQMSESAIGLHAMATRHLNALHYVVLEVSIFFIFQIDRSKKSIFSMAYCGGDAQVHFSARCL